MSVQDVQLKDVFGGTVTKGNFTTKIDTQTEGVTYIGKAQIGTATSVALWQIKRVLVDDTTTTISFAGGTDTFSKEWDERATYTYS